MDKILIELYVPAMGAVYDVFIPRKSKTHDVLFLLSETVEELTEGRYLPTQDVVLCRENGEILNINMSIAEHGLLNGSMLMLI